MESETVHHDSRRRAKRISPNQKIKVINFINGDDIGSIINMSINGIMLTSRVNISNGQIFQTQLSIGNDKVYLGIECLWKDQQRSGMNILGFAIIDISEDDQQKLSKFIESN